MAKKINILYAILIGISLVAVCITMFHPGLYITHDGVNHVARFTAYIRAFHEYHFPPRWAGYLNYSYGSPVFIFFYPIPGYLAALCSLIIQNPESLFKLLSFFSFIAAPITFYCLVRAFLSKQYAVTVSAMYGLSLYHIANLLIRGDVAELVSITFIPIFFLLLEKKISWENMVWGGIFYALTILSHNGISFLFTPIIVLYMCMKIVQTKSVRLTIYYLGTLIIGLSLSAFFWIPALFEKKYTNISLFTGDFYKENFLRGFHSIFAPWGFGPNVNMPGGFAPQLGSIPVILFAFLFIRLFWKRQFHTRFIFWFLVLLFSAFMTTSQSAYIWGTIPFLKIIQFPWRFLAISNFALFVAIAYGLKEFRPASHAIPLLLLCLTTISVLPYITVAGYESRSETIYTEFPNTTYFHGEVTTVWSTGDFSAYPKSPIEVVAGIATISSYIKSNANHTYTIEAETPANIVDNTLYYPGWQVRVDGNKVPIEFQNQQHRGLITYTVKKGTHTVRAVFRETPIRLASDLISGIMLLVVIGFAMKKLFQHAYT